MSTQAEEMTGPLLMHAFPIDREQSLDASFHRFSSGRLRTRGAATDEAIYRPRDLLAGATSNASSSSSDMTSSLCGWSARLFKTSRITKAVFLGANDYSPTRAPPSSHSPVACSAWAERSSAWSVEQSTLVLLASQVFEWRWIANFSWEAAVHHHHRP